jgi:ribosomal protein S18 acetylase RimI-like enzyme
MPYICEKKAMIQYSTPSLKDAKEIYLLGTCEFNWIYEKIAWELSVVEWYIKYHRSYCFIALKGDSIVGFHFSFVEDDIGYMGWVAVNKEYRRYNIANQLLDMTLEKMRSNKNILNVYAHVRNDNIVNSWLKRRGFVDINQQKVEMKYTLKEK